MDQNDAVNICKLAVRIWRMKVSDIEDTLYEMNLIILHYMALVVTRFVYLG